MITIAQKAIQLAHLANEDEALKKALHSGVEHAEKNRQSVHGVYIRMLTSEKLGKAKLDETPVPGSKEGNNPDAFEGVNELTGKKENGTFTNIFADNLDEGVQIRTSIKNIAESKDMADPEKERHVKRWNQRLTTLRGLVRRALLAHHKMHEITNRFPQVGISFATVEKPDGKGGTVETYDLNTNSPFCLVDKKPSDSSKPQAYRYLSYGEFLSLKPDVAEKNKVSMGEWKSLVNSGKKGKKKGTAQQPVAGALVSHITTVDKFTDYAAEMVAYLRGVGGSDDGKGYSRIMSKLATLPKGDERKRFVLLLGGLAMELDGIWNDINNEYNTYTKEQNAINAGEKKEAA